jgi:hypothetical protein
VYIHPSFHSLTGSEFFDGFWYRVSMLQPPIEASPAVTAMESTIIASAGRIVGTWFVTVVAGSTGG